MYSKTEFTVLLFTDFLKNNYILPYLTFAHVSPPLSPESSLNELPERHMQYDKNHHVSLIAPTGYNVLYTPSN